MPTYEYKCKSCGKAHEAFQSMKDAPLRKCPHCGKNTLERQIGTGAAVLFKGSGFYQTDYRSESYKKAASAETSNGTPAKSEPAKTDAKPAKAESPAPTADTAKKPPKAKKD